MGDIAPLRPPDLGLAQIDHIEHGAQMNLLLGQNGVTGPDWIAQARDI